MTNLTNDQLMKAILRTLKENSKSFADAAKLRKRRAKLATKTHRNVSKRLLPKASGSRSK